MPMTEKYKTDKPLSFKGRETPLVKKKKPRPKLETYKGTSWRIKPNPSAQGKRKGL